MTGTSERQAGAWLNGQPRACTGCRTEHMGMFALAPRAPDAWPGVEHPEPNHALRLDGEHFLFEAR